jgi:hypothetical protein
MLWLAVVGALAACQPVTQTHYPFPLNEGLSFREVSFGGRRSGLTGDGFTAGRWEISGGKNLILDSVVPFNIWNRIVWLSPDDVRFTKAFVYLGRFDEMNAVLPEVQSALRNQDARVAFENMIVSDRGIEACSLWIVNPSDGILIYLSAKG